MNITQEQDNGYLSQPSFTGLMNTQTHAYTYEKHGYGYAIYYGRNNFFHGSKCGECEKEEEAKMITDIFNEYLKKQQNGIK